MNLTGTDSQTNVETAFPTLVRAYANPIEIEPRKNSAMSTKELNSKLETLRAAQEAYAEGMPRPKMQRKEYLNALAAAYEAGMLVAAAPAN